MVLPSCESHNFLPTKPHVQCQHPFMQSDGRFKTSIPKSDCGSHIIQEIDDDAKVEEGELENECIVCYQSDFPYNGQKLDKPIFYSESWKKIEALMCYLTLVPSFRAIYLFLVSMTYSGVYRCCYYSMHPICMFRTRDKCYMSDLETRSFCLVGCSGSSQYQHILCDQFVGKLLFFSALSVWMCFDNQDHRKKRAMFLRKMFSSEKDDFDESFEEKSLMNVMHSSSIIQESCINCSLQWKDLLKRIWSPQMKESAVRAYAREVAWIEQRGGGTEFSKCLTSHVCSDCLDMWILGNFLHAPSCLREAEQAKNKKFFNRKKAVFEWNEMMFCLLGKEVKKNLYQSGTYVYALLEHHCSFSSLKSLRWNSDSDYFDRPVRRKWSRFASSDLSLYNNYIQLAALVKEEINARPIFSRFIVALRRCIRKLFFLLKNIFCCLNIHRKEATENGSLP